MDASERATILANAISEGVNHLAHIRSLHDKAHVASSDELEEWREAIDQAWSAFTETQVEIEAGRAQTSLRLTSDLLRSFADVYAGLSAIAPGAQLPATLFDLVDVAWSELSKSMR